MKRIVTNTVLASAITLAPLTATAQATAEPALPLDPAATATDAPPATGTGSATTMANTLSSLSGGNTPAAPAIQTRP
ncbi:hypothetical protein [Nocardia iowensis]|uniref:Uncharacterized protein n=1 Tax=Nocardia iowensis TaxID=204891 RepID=A0ABX8RJE2_NOCIO|nr:hypothetical protein [Nocardia iowensis]QXN89739.1 hypothetical protein KV110_30345 [Nocardia iowensis]